MTNDEKETCIVVTCFDENQPGFLDFSYRIKSLAINYHLTIISSFRLTQAELVFDGIDYIVIDSKKSRLGWLGYLCRCAKYIRRKRPNFAMLLHSMAAPISILVGNIPTVTYWNEHPTHVAPAPIGFSPIKQITRWSIRWLMYRGAAQSALVMPIGEAHQSDLIAHGCKPSKVQMIYMGVAQTFYQVALTNSIRPENAPLKLLYVGSVQKDRGRDLMLEAIAFANKFSKIVHLTIVGASDDQLKTCQDTIKYLDIEQHVSVRGRVPGHMIPSFMATADAGLCIWDNLPWYRFNPPTKLFEYLVSGLPVLASNIMTHSQYIKDDDNGLLFEYDSASLAMAIKRFWHARARINQMKQCASDSSTPYLWSNIEPQFMNDINNVSQQ